MTIATKKRFNKDGREVVDDGSPLKPGEYFRVPMVLMDNQVIDAADVDAFFRDKNKPAVHARGHDPAMALFQRGYRVGPAADLVAAATKIATADTTELLSPADASYAERRDKLSRACMTPVQTPATPPLAKKDEAPVINDAESAYQAYAKRLADAWRNPPPLALTTTGDTASFTPRAGLSPQTATEADVNAAIAARDSRLENAWR
jgi:hypothetical protein